MCFAQLSLSQLLNWNVLSAILGLDDNWSGLLLSGWSLLEAKSFFLMSLEDIFARFFFLG